jgi:peptide/nickel transport system permease protein
MTLRSYIARRFAYTLVLVLFVIVLNWIIFQLMPGVQGSISSLIGRVSPGGSSANEQAYQNYLSLYGLNKPPLERFITYFWDTLTLNFGTSFQTQHPVIQDIVQSGRLENTLVLLGTSTVLSIVVGVFFGIWAAHKRGTPVDGFWTSVSITTYSLPTFWMGLSFILIFALTLGWFPSGNVEPNNWAQGALLPSLPVQLLIRLQYLFLPALTLTLFSYGGFLLLTRATMLETLGDDYVMTARAKGLSERTVLFKHAFKNASLPIVTASALAFGTILSGAIITETVFNWDGLGRWLFNAIGYKDYPVMQAMFFLLALSVIIANFISDIVYGIIDPRIKYE